MKALKALNMKEGERRAGRTKIGRITALRDTSAPTPSYLVDQTHRHYSITVSTSIWATQGVPYRETEARARRIIGNELYGEAIDELQDALRDLWEEGLPDDHPALLKIKRLIRSMQGETAPHLDHHLNRA